MAMRIIKCPHTQDDTKCEECKAINRVYFRKRYALNLSTSHGQGLRRQRSVSGPNLMFNGVPPKSQTSRFRR